MSTIPSVSNQLDHLFAGNALKLAEIDAPTVLIVSADANLQDSLAEVLEGHRANIEWMRGVEGVKNAFAKAEIAACLCGFSLEDGTYKDVVKQAKRQTVETPVIIVSTPRCPNEYREYLAAMNAGAFDFLCHPYQKRELERILGLALSAFRRMAVARHF